jgi:hypothetical protein
MSEQMQYSKKDKRIMSGFMVREFLYQFLFGKLEKTRIDAVETFINESSAIRDSIKKMKNTDEYLAS